MFDRRALITAAAALPLAACAARYTPAPRKGLRLATFNIWHNAGNWPLRQKLLIDALRQTDADLIAFQEVLQDAAKGLPNQAETLAAGLPGYTVHFSSVDPEEAPKRYGNAILTRLPVLETASKKLEPLNDYRTALRVRVDADGRPADVVVTHLAHQADAGPVRAQQINDLLAWLPRQAEPLVILGDFNAPLSDSGLTPLAARGLETALPPGAAPTTLNPAMGHHPRVIDHIFYERAHFTVEAARVFADQPVNGEPVSDHFGVTATLGWR